MRINANILTKHVDMKCIFKIILLMTVTLCCLNPLSAQEEKTTQYVLKLYYNSQNTVAYFTPGFSIVKPKTSHEFELSYLRGGIGIINETNKIINYDNGGYDSSLEGMTVSGFGIRLRYEYGGKLSTINEKFNFALHGSVEPYFSIYRRNVELDNERLSRGSLIGGRFYLVPRGTYDIGERYFIDLNFPIEIMNIGTETHHYETSSVDRLFRQNYLGFFTDLLRFRIGIGLKL